MMMMERDCSSRATSRGFHRTESPEGRLMECTAGFGATRRFRSARRTLAFYGLVWDIPLALRQYGRFWITMR
jgi:hypothetical protein